MGKRKAIQEKPSPQEDPQKSKPKEDNIFNNESVNSVIKALKLRQIQKGQGRKYFDGKNPAEVILKLQEVWACGGTDEEAAFYADISKASLCQFLKEYKIISERKQALLNNPTLKARRSVVNGLEGNPELALKYLERKKSNEFALRSRVDVNDITEEKDEGPYADTDEGKLLAEYRRRRQAIPGGAKKAKP